MMVKSILTVLWAISLWSVVSLMNIPEISQRLTGLISLLVILYVILGIAECRLLIKAARYYQSEYVSRPVLSSESGPAMLDVDKARIFHRTVTLCAPVTVFKCWTFTIALLLAVFSSWLFVYKIST